MKTLSLWNRALGPAYPALIWLVLGLILVVQTLTNIAGFAPGQIFLQKTRLPALAVSSQQKGDILWSKSYSGISSVYESPKVAR